MVPKAVSLSSWHETMGTIRINRDCQDYLTEYTWSDTPSTTKVGSGSIWQIMVWGQIITVFPRSSRFSQISISPVAYP